MIRPQTSRKQWTVLVCDSLGQSELVQFAVRVEGVDLPQVEQLLQSLVDEDEADERGEGFLREAGDVAHQRAGVRGDQHQTQEGRPQADARPQRQVGQVVVPEAEEEEGV